MFILARYEGEVIHLHTNEGLVKIEVTEVNPQSGKIRLGFEAPDSIDIIRAEMDIIDPITA